MPGKRILWIENHKLPILTEVPLLRNLGYQVYTPKILPFDTGVRVEQGVPAPDWMAPGDLALLDETDFYGQGPSRRVVELIGRSFDMVFFGFVPAAIEPLVDDFPGMLVLRAYGREHRQESYTKGIVSELGLFTLHKIESLGSRFVFAQAFPHLKDFECAFFQDHALDFPLCLSLFSKEQSRWRGGRRQVLYACPGIRMLSERAQRYEAFQKNFASLPYVVAGAQPVAMREDDRVLGYLPDADYIALYEESACLYEDAREPGYLAPAMLDALRVGLPVVYLKGGLLSRLIRGQSPGECKDAAAAKKKIRKLLRGSEKLTRGILSTQANVMRRFSEDECLPMWRRFFDRISELQKIPQIPLFGKEKKRIAVLLPEAFTGGVLDYTLRLVSALQQGLRDAGHPAELVFGHVDHAAFSERDYFRPLRELGIPVRSFTWEMFGTGRAQEIVNVRGYSVSVIPVGAGEEDAGQEYCVPNDGIAYFEDCDYLLFTSDRVPGFPLLMQPYGVISHDFVQRFVPGIIDPARNEDFLLQVMRRAKAVYTTTPVTLERAVQYAGVSEKRVHLIPFFFSAEGEGERPAPRPEGPEDYFLWSTNTTPHKRHREALSALSEYYATGGTLRCCITGVKTRLFSPDLEPQEELHEYVREIRDRIAQDPVLRDRLAFYGNLPKAQYQQLLAGARFFFHPGFADNGNGTAFDAAWLGVPTLSNDYRPMRYYDEQMGLGMRFFQIDDGESVVSALHEAQRDAAAFSAGVPSREALRRFTVEDPQRALALYRAILEPAAVL